MLPDLALNRMTHSRTKPSLYAPDLAAGELGRVLLDSGSFGALPLER